MNGLEPLSTACTMCFPLKLHPHDDIIIVTGRHWFRKFYKGSNVRAYFENIAVLMQIEGSVLGLIFSLGITRRLQIFM